MTQSPNHTLERDAHYARHIVLLTSFPNSARLAFRPYADSDVESVQVLFSDPYARQFYPSGGSREAAQRWIAWSQLNYEKYGFGLWALQLHSDGSFVGDAGLTLQDVEGQSMLEIGYHINADLRGKGLATEAAQACLRWAFEHTEHQLVCSIVDPLNKASIAVARRIHTLDRTFSGRSGERMLFYTQREARVPL